MTNLQKQLDAGIVRTIKLAVALGLVSDEDLGRLAAALDAASGDPEGTREVVLGFGELVRDRIRGRRKLLAGRRPRHYN